jgi:putative endonuclease
LLLHWLLQRLDDLRFLLARDRGKRARGRRAEDLVHRYLQKNGFRILARNWVGPHLAEVDIVAMEGERIVFVEVKSRADEEHGSPERSIGAMKVAAQRRAARAWATRAGCDVSVIRFDVVTVVLEVPPRIEHHRDASSLRRSKRS